MVLRKLIDQMQEWVAEKQAAIMNWLSNAKYTMHHLPEANFTLGQRFAAEGKLHDAVFRFKFALKLRPDWDDAWYQLGLCYMRLNHYKDAASAFQKTLQITPAYEDARYLLAVVAPQSMPVTALPTTMPARMVQGFFTEIASQYVAMEQQNQYQAPVKMVEALRPYLSALSGLNVLDAGCGIGHLAMRWRKVAGRLVGVDFTRAMVDQAKLTVSAEDTPLFDAVFTGDIRALAQYVSKESQDVILCGNVLQFVGDLSHAFQEFSYCLKPGGLLAITVEPYVQDATGLGFGIVASSARFGHNAHYIAGLAEQFGFTILKQERTEIYPKMPCGLVVLQKKTGVAAEAPSSMEQA